MKKSRRFTQKLFLTYTCMYWAALLFLFLIVLGLFYLQQYGKTQENQRQLVSKTSEQVDSSLQSMDRIANGLLFNNTFLQFMKHPGGEPYSNDAEQQILNAFTALDAPLFSTHRIIAFNDSHFFNLSKSGENQNYMEQAAENWAWKEQLLAKEGQKLFIPPHQDPFDNLPHCVYSVARPVNDGSGSYAVVEVQNDYQELEKLCSLSPRSGQIVLYSPEGELIYPSDPDPEETDFFEALFSTVHSASGTAPPDTVAGLDRKSVV